MMFSIDGKAILTGGFAGTSLMSTYSYVASAIQKEQFREPQLLSQWIGDKVSAAPISTLPGWIIHYGVGFFFATAYRQLWKRKRMDNAIGTFLLGVTSGAIGVLVWRKVLKSHPSPPGDEYSFFRHLLLAHVLFAFGVKQAAENLQS